MAPSRTSVFTTLILALALARPGVALAEGPAPAASSAAAPAAPSKSQAASTPQDPARAKALFDEAAQLTGEGKFEQACTKLEESLKLLEGVGTAFNLARCWQKIGRTASAYALFEKVVQKTKELGQTERHELARTKLEALLPKLSRLRVDIDAASRAPNMVVHRGKAALPESDWGKPIPMDPAEYEIRVTADGKEPWATKVKISDPGMTVAVVVPVLEKATPKPAAVAVVAKPKPVAPPPPKPAESKPSNGWVVPVGIGAAAVGVGGIVLGSIKGSQYKQLNSDAEAICPSGINCTPSEIASHEQALADSRAARNWSYVSFAVGGVALASAGYLLFLAPRGKKESPKVGRLSAVPIVTPEGWGATLEGSF